MSNGDAGLNMPDIFEALCAAVTETVQRCECEAPERPAEQAAEKWRGVDAECWVS